MTTLDQLRQRLEDQYLEPATEETPTAPLAVGITDTDTEIILTPGVLSPDEESFIGPNRLLEIDMELVRVVSYNENTKTAQIRRGARGTVAAAHAINTDVRIPTRWTRTAQIAALRASIEALWQPLFTFREEWTVVGTAKWVPLPLNTVRILDVLVEGIDGRYTSIKASLFAVHPNDEQAAGLQLEENPPRRSELINIRYGVRPVAPDDIFEEIEDFPSKYERIVLVDAAAELLGGIDIDAVSQEMITEKMKLENLPISSAARITQQLIRYREYLVEKAHAELKAMFPRKVEHRKMVYRK